MNDDDPIARRARSPLYRDRARGAVIDPKIPDHATVPRASIRMTPQGGASWERDGDTYRMPAVATFTEPFTWDDAQSP